MLVTQSCPSLCDPMDCSPPGSSVCGILQARILEWVAIPGESSQLKNRIQASCIAGRFFIIQATREAPHYLIWEIANNQEKMFSIFDLCILFVKWAFIYRAKDKIDLSEKFYFVHSPIDILFIKVGYTLYLFIQAVLEKGSKYLNLIMFPALIWHINKTRSALTQLFSHFK